MPGDNATPATLRIAARFNGPFNSGNGGYSAGLVARALGAAEGQAVEATLRAPVPLETTLRAHPGADGLDVMTDDAENRILIMSLRAVSMEAPAILSPGLDAIRAAAPQDFDDHPLPLCFVCGPDRQRGDGLRIFTSPVAPEDNPNTTPLVAAPWTPGSDLADESGLIAPEYIWAALDCPGAFALDAEPILLGRMTARIDAAPRPDEDLVIAAWSRGAEGRKHFASTALFSRDGALLAFSEQTWIRIDAHAPAMTRARI